MDSLQINEGGGLVKKQGEGVLEGGDDTLIYTINLAITLTVILIY